VYEEYDSEDLFQLPVMARKLASHFVAPLPAMIPIDSELDSVGIWDTMQDSEYKSKNEIGYPMDTKWS
jgi:hypothetical protein